MCHILGAQNFEENLKIFDGTYATGSCKRKVVLDNHKITYTNKIY